MHTSDLSVSSFSRFYLTKNREDGFRVGGNPPKNVIPKWHDENTRYFMTVPLLENLEVSLFHSFNFEQDGTRNPFDSDHVLFSEECNLIQFVLHTPSPREKDACVLKSELSGHGCDLAKVQESETHQGYGYHKFGGIPVFERQDQLLNDLVEVSYKEGFQHFFQLAFPIESGDAVVSGNWPFGEMLFHVFLKYKNREFQFRYVWG